MANVSLEKVDGFFEAQLKDPELRKHYQLERAKVTLAQKIAQMRQEKRLNQKELAIRLGVSQQFISRIETGDSRNMTVDTLVGIARSLGRGIKISFPKTHRNSSHLEVA